MCVQTIWFAIVTNILRLLKGRVNDNDTVMSITKMLLIRQQIYFERIRLETCEGSVDTREREMVKTRAKIPRITSHI